MDVMDLENIDADAPIFDPQAFGLSDEEAELNAIARSIGRSRFALRAAEYDRDARFPTENYKDMREAGLLGVCVPKDHGGLGASFRAYSTAAAEVGRYCGATALTVWLPASIIARKASISSIEPPPILSKFGRIYYGAGELSQIQPHIMMNGHFSQENAPISIGTVGLQALPGRSGTRATVQRAPASATPAARIVPAQWPRARLS
jgi:hypothetical protein